MGEFTIKVLNWEKYNGSKKYGHNRFYFDQNFFSSIAAHRLSPAGKVIWLFILSRCAVAGQSTISLTASYIQSASSVPASAVQSAVRTLEACGSIQIIKGDFMELSKEVNKERKKTEPPKRVSEPAASRPVFDLEFLYREYPLKEGKKGGLKVCKRVIKTQQDYENVLYAIRRYTAAKAGSKFIQHFSTFMNNWEDWLDPQTGTVAQNKPKPLIDHSIWDKPDPGYEPVDGPLPEGFPRV